MTSNLIFYDAAMLQVSLSQEFAYVELIVAQGDLWSLNYQHAVELLRTLSGTPQKFLTLRQSLTLRFEGFDSKLEEWIETPQLVHFVRSIFKQWPFFLHFLDCQSGDLTRVLALLNIPRLLGAGSTLTHQHFDVSQEVIALMIMSASKLNRLHVAFEPEQYFEDLERDIRQYFPSSIKLNDLRQSRRLI